MVAGILPHSLYGVLISWHSVCNGLITLDFLLLMIDDYFTLMNKGTLPWHDVMQALSHFSYHVSGGSLVLCDLQGIVYIYAHRPILCRLLLFFLLLVVIINQK